MAGHTGRPSACPGVSGFGLGASQLIESFGVLSGETFLGRGKFPICAGFCVGSHGILVWSEWNLDAANVDKSLQLGPMRFERLGECDQVIEAGKCGASRNFLAGSAKARLQ